MERLKKKRERIQKFDISRPKRDPIYITYS